MASDDSSSDAPNSISELIERAQLLGKQIGTSSPWYRGNGRTDYDLIPTVYRRPHCIQSERSYANEFRSRAPSRHHPCPPNDDHVGWLMMMRHYGLPTRLLDWTESLLVAAFFAVTDKQGAKGEEGCIWLLHPGRLNHAEGGGSGLFSIRSSAVIAQADAVFLGSSSDLPKQQTIAFVGQEIDPRLTVQQSMFTIHHGRCDLRKHVDAPKLLRRISIPPSSKTRILDELTQAGIREMSLFPDLEHLSRWIPGYIAQRRMEDLGYIE